MTKKKQLINKNENADYFIQNLETDGASERFLSSVDSFVANQTVFTAERLNASKRINGITKYLTKTISTIYYDGDIELHFISNYYLPAVLAVVRLGSSVSPFMFV